MRTLRSLLATAALVAVLPVALHAEDATVIASMDDLRFQPPREKGGVEAVEGKVGRAVRFRFDAGTSGGFATSNIRGTPAWDRAGGFSFWVKGNGGNGFGGLEFIDDDDYAVRYDLMFPYKADEWSRVTVAWNDLIPALPGPKAKPLGGPRGNAPSSLSAFWVGRWWYWGAYPALDFTLDDVRLEPTVTLDVREYRPEGLPLARVRARLKAGKPVTIVTMGDSLTDRRHWANRQVAWPDFVKDGIKAAYGSDVRVVNPAIGGTQLRQNLVLMPRWLAEAPEPDLVTVFFGGNDWEGGMRGAEFAAACADAVDRIRRATRGKADVLLLTTNPVAARWGELAELAVACRRATVMRNAGLADTEAAFLSAGAKDRDRLYVDDRVHLSRDGHRLVADVVLRAIEAGGR